MSNVTTGSCLCESVSFEVSGSISKVYFCHCKQCRSWGGHFAAAAGIKKSQLSFSKSEGLNGSLHLKWPREDFVKIVDLVSFGKKKGHLVSLFGLGQFQI